MHVKIENGAREFKAGIADCAYFWKHAGVCESCRDTYEYWLLACRLDRQEDTPGLPVLLERVHQCYQHNYN